MTSTDLIVVIRTAGERTFGACRSLVEQQLRSTVIEVVRETPFEKALRTSYEVGIRHKARWTMTLDADVLLRDGAITRLIAEANKTPETVVQLEGRVHDKILGTYRPAGHRIYRTSLLQQALANIPEAGTELRPEYATLQRMQSQGFPSRAIEFVVGIHDYQQYYRDVYRKSFIHANKTFWFIKNFVERSKPLASHDQDFLVALRGLYDGLISLAPVTIDATRFPRLEMTGMLEELLLREKPELDDGQLGFPYVEAVLADAGPAPPFESRAVKALRKAAYGLQLCADRIHAINGRRRSPLPR